MKIDDHGKILNAAWGPGRDPAAYALLQKLQDNEKHLARLDELEGVLVNSFKGQPFVRPTVEGARHDMEILDNSIKAGTYGMAN